MGENCRNFEDLSTLFRQIDILNSRQNGLVSNDPKDHTISTPAHFISSGRLDCLPTKETTTSVEHDNCTSAARSAHIQNLPPHFWKSWKKQYVPSMQGG